MSAALAYFDWRDSMDGLSKLIQGWMARTGKIQGDLAEEVGVSEKTISRWKNQESFPRPQNQPRLAEILDVTPDELVAAIEAGREAGPVEDSGVLRLERRGVAAKRDFVSEWADQVAQDADLQLLARSVLLWLPRFLGPRGRTDIFITPPDLLEHADVHANELDAVWLSVVGSGYLRQLDDRGRVFQLVKKR